MAITKRKIGLVHVAKSQLGLCASAYKKMLFEIAGVQSSKQLDDVGFEALMVKFKQLGFESTWNKKQFGYRAGMATPNQVAYIRSLWEQFTQGEGTEKGLNTWLGNKFGIAALRFLDKDTARKVVPALKKMADRKKS